MGSTTATPRTAAFSEPVLSLDERVSEVIFGLIMALTFTGSLSVASADRAEVREMLRRMADGAGKMKGRPGGDQPRQPDPNNDKK